MVNPPQGENFQQLYEATFPEEYPFDPVDVIGGKQWFFLKYYISQRTFFTIPSQFIYCNFEVLCNAFAAKVINTEQAEIWEI